MKKDSLTYTVIFSFSITFIFVFVLSLVASLTNKRVELARKIAIEKAYLTASGVNIPEGKDIQEIFTNTFSVDFPGDEPLRADIDGRSIVVSPFEGEGLWGTITGVIALENTFDRIVGVEITSHSETPGLGGRIDEDWFKDQFKGERADTDLKIVQSGGQGDTDPENGILDGITGATRTSQALENIINRQIRSLKGDASLEDSLSEAEKIKYHYLAASGITPGSSEELISVFEDVFSSSDISSGTITGNLNGREITASSFVSEGLWGEILGVLAIDMDSQEVLGFEVISHSEKAGAPITELWFKEQFRGLKTQKGVRVVQGEMSMLDKESGIVDGISGATTTNLGIETGINEVLAALKGGL